jgi:hypothetical protein
MVFSAFSRSFQNSGAAVFCSRVSISSFIRSESKTPPGIEDILFQLLNWSLQFLQHDVPPVVVGFASQYTEIRRKMPPATQRHAT